MGVGTGLINQIIFKLQFIFGTFTATIQCCSSRQMKLKDLSSQNLHLAFGKIVCIRFGATGPQTSHLESMFKGPNFKTVWKELLPAHLIHIPLLFLSERIPMLLETAECMSTKLSFSLFSKWGWIMRYKYESLGMWWWCYFEKNAVGWSGRPFSPCPLWCLEKECNG